VKASRLTPVLGVFTTDSTTQMSWFQPGSLEPLYKYELIGLLTSLAVYNGLTLPFTFPLALYSKLLDQPVSRLADIEDGWPELTKGLRTLHDWPEDNVESVFMRPFVFSVNVFGTTVDVDMDKARKTHFRRLERAEVRIFESIYLLLLLLSLLRPCGERCSVAPRFTVKCCGKGKCWCEVIPSLSLVAEIVAFCWRQARKAEDHTYSITYHCLKNSLSKVYKHAYIVTAVH
jgi:hypothetical protein